MKRVNLYRYIRQDGGVTISPNVPNCEYDEMIRLVSDADKILSNGEKTALCIDTTNEDEWHEIDLPKL